MLAYFPKRDRTCVDLNEMEVGQGIWEEVRVGNYLEYTVLKIVFH